MAMAVLACVAVCFTAAPARAQFDSVLVFNEVHYHPTNELTQTEWIELRSLQGVDVDIGGWRIEGGVDYTFPNGTVMPGGGYLVVAATPAQIPGALGPFVGQLDNGGEKIRLVNRNGRVMDELDYDDEGEWPLATDGAGFTLARRSATAAAGPAQWSNSFQLGGTPGGKNFAEPSDPPTVTTLIPYVSSWKYRDNNQAQPANWNTIGFDDTTWSSGNALLYAGSPTVSGAGEGLHGYWPLEETSGSFAPNLVSGGTTGVLFPGAAWVNDGTRGKVLNFDGVDGYVNAGSIPQMTLTNHFTWSFWTNSQQTGGNVILGNRYNFSGPSNEFNPREFIKFTSDRLQFHRNAVNTEDIDYTDVPVGSWVHHALVKQGTSLIYYRNGVAAGSKTISQGLNNPQPFYMGGDRTVENWAGRMDDVALWNKALPAASIVGLANGTVTPLTAPTGSSVAPLTTAVTQGPTTHYFRKTFNFSGAKERTTLALQHLFDDGAVVYLNGTEVLRVNLPGGVISHTTPASNNITSTVLSANLPIPADALVNGTNVLAVEVHQHASDSDLVFGLQLVASEAPLTTNPVLVFNELSGAADSSPFVELKNTSGAPVSTQGWFINTYAFQNTPLPLMTIPAGGVASFTLASLGIGPADGLRLFLQGPGGTMREVRDMTSRLRGLTAEGRWGHPSSPTPGTANVVTVSDAIVINEIFYHGIDDSPEQWVELYNRSGAPVNISGWKFTDGISYQFPANTPAVPAGGYVVLAWDPAAFATLHAGVTALGPFSGNLSRSGELLTLRDANDNVADQLRYADDGRWSGWADGGGSSLELKDPDADNAQPEAWDASDETSKSSWVTVSAASYQGAATKPNAGDPADYNEFVFGLLNSGEFLIDDISVRNVTQGNIELIQNGTFAGGTAAFWRIIGTHGGTIVDDPSSPGNKVLKVAASGATEHMHNHAETTLKVSGGGYHTIVDANTYSISFRARWLRGSNRLHTRLWHNRLARQTLLPRPVTGGTPGAVNSRAVANLGPTFADLGHAPTVPEAGQSATVAVKVTDGDGINAVELFTSVNGAAFASTAMATSGDGIYRATVPAQTNGAQVQFYVRATDALGAVSFFPAAGAASQAMIPWQDGRAQLVLASGAKPHNVRIVMTAAATSEMLKLENLMSDAAVPCTVIYDEREAYYHAAVRLRSSEHGRISEGRCGFTLEFGSDQLFLGAHDTIGIDRSGGISGGQKEILLKRMMNSAGGIYAPEDDIIRVISPVGTNPPGTFTGANMTGAAIMSKTRLDREYLDAQFPNGGDGAMQKYERVYVLTQTINPGTRVVDAAIVPENPKVPQDTTAPPGVNVNSLGANKENYRWYWLIQNARDADDYTGIMNVVTAIGQTGGSVAFNTQVDQYINVNTWLRAVGPPNLYGVIDNYLGTPGTGQHNGLIYFPPGQKAVLIPWDLDYLSQVNPTTTSLETGGDVGKFLMNPVYKRLYYGNLLDVLDRSFTNSFMTQWATHYSRFGTDDMTAMVSSYLTPRATYARNKVTGSNGETAPIPFVSFTRTSASPVSVATPFATITGDGWINIAEIRLQGSNYPLALTWTDDNSWSVQLPIRAGVNSYTLVAIGRDGTQLGTVSVTVNGTGSLFTAGPGNLVISELHYNPPGSGDATEFVELLNVTGATLDLSGCHFDTENGQGIDYTFPNGVQLAAGARIVIARDRAAFLAAYPAFSGQLAPNDFSSTNLDNAGETLVLYAASGLEIFRLTYTDTVPGTDGDGLSMVRLLSSTAPNGNTVEWRASTTNGGNPGTTDAVAFVGNATDDLDHDGIPALLEYAFGTSDTVFTPFSLNPSIDGTGNIQVRFPHQVNADDVILSFESTANLSTPFAPALAQIVDLAYLGPNRVTERWTVFKIGTNYFVRLKATRR